MTQVAEFSIGSLVFFEAKEAPFLVCLVKDFGGLESREKVRTVSREKQTLVHWCNPANRSSPPRGQTFAHEQMIC